jgi:hypothetical protein
MILIDYRKIATQNPDIVAPWHQTERALYFRTAEQAGRWAAEFGGTQAGRVVRVDDETGSIPA